MTKRIIVLALSLLFVFSAVPTAGAVPTSGTVGDTLMWSVQDGVLKISGTGKLPDWSSTQNAPWFPFIHVIEKIEVEEGVSYIGSWNFGNLGVLKSVTLPDSVEFIGFAAFSGCIALLEINMPANLKMLANGVFSDAWALREVYFPENVETIGAYVFSNAKSLQKITVAKNNPYYETDEAGVLYTKGKKVLVKVPEAIALTSYVIPDSVEKIGQYAFAGCQNVTAVTFAEGSTLTEIEEFAFHNTKIEKLVLPETVTTLGKACFYQNPWLSEITLPDNITYVPSMALSYCAFRKLVLPKNLLQIDSIEGNPNLREIVFPEGIKHIGVIRECVFLEEIHLPASVESFRGAESCLYHKRFTVAPENPFYSVDEHGVLFNKDKTRIIAFPIGATMESYTLPETVTSIEWNCFQRIKGLKHLTLSEGITTIPAQGFLGATSLRSVTLPESLLEIEVNGFNACTNLKNVYFRGTPRLQTIGQNAFYKTAIESFHLPDSVEKIRASAFGSCLKLRDFYVSENSRLTNAEHYVFGFSPLVTLHAPSGSILETIAVQDGVNVQIPVMINGNAVSFPMPTRIRDDRVLVPMRAMCEALSVEVSWSDAERTAIATKGNTTVIFRPGSDILNLNGHEVQMDTKAFILDERMLVPIRAFGEAFGHTVLWDRENRTVNLES